MTHPTPTAGGGHTADPWLPIETAPKDGRVIDLWIFWPEHGNESRSPDAAWDLGAKCWRFADGWFDKSFAFKPIVTHWMPIPPPPAAQAKASSHTKEGERG